MVEQMEHLDRNYEILKKHLIETMENRLAFGNDLIEKELHLGALDFIAKPIVKAFYKYWSNNDAKEGVLKQIDATLDCCKILVINGNDSEERYKEIVEDYFQDYLQGDQLYYYCKKKHKNFIKLKEVLKETFESDIKGTLILLKIQDITVDDYNGLIKVAFKTKEEAYKTLAKRLDFTDESIKIVEKDLSILKIPTGKKIIMKIFRKGFDQTRLDFLENLNRIYI
ncbi:MAG: hypothetical protein ACFFAS_19245 [Promethearchaeota archaeon]